MANTVIYTTNGVFFVTSVLNRRETLERILENKFVTANTNKGDMVDIVTSHITAIEKRDEGENSD